MRRALLFLAFATACATPPAPRAANDEADARQVAERYLAAVAGTGDESGLDLLLGGATANARLFALENWRIEKAEPPRHEEGDLALAARGVEELDQASRDAMAGLVGQGTGAESVTIEQLSPEAAAQLMGPTQASADRLTAAFPLLAAVLRVGQAVYWNPKNPARALLAKADGPYTLDFRGYEIESKEGPRKVVRRWKLAVVRFTSAGQDTGWKVLPAADWNAE